jgi:hypothetical protein
MQWLRTEGRAELIVTDAILQLGTGEGSTAAALCPGMTYTIPLAPGRCCEPLGEPTQPAGPNLRHARALRRRRGTRHGWSAHLG